MLNGQSIDATTPFAVFLVAKLNKSGIVELVVVELRLRLKLKRL